MPGNNMPKQRRGVTLRTPGDVRRVIQRITSKAFKDGSELENAGKISQLMACWLKAWELEKIGDIEARVTALETTGGKNSEKKRH
jgi:hypothetical protein